LNIEICIYWDQKARVALTLKINDADLWKTLAIKAQNGVAQREWPALNYPKQANVSQIFSDPFQAICWPFSGAVEFCLSF